MELWVSQAAGPGATIWWVTSRNRRRRWRYYETASGRKPVKVEIDSLPEDQRDAVLAEMRAIRQEGDHLGKRVRGEIREVIVPCGDITVRVLYAKEGRSDQILLALEAFAKKTRKTPQPKITLAEKRLADWRSRNSSIDPK
jgi:phage-related protein